MNEVGKEYGAALFMLGCEDGCEKQYLEELEAIAQIFQNEKEFLSFLATPSVPMQARIDTLGKVISAVASRRVVSFMQLLLEKGRLSRFEEAKVEYARLFEEASRVMKVKIRSAVALSEDQKQRLQTKLETIHTAKVFITYEIDPSLIGGVVMETDDKVTDGSIRHRLQEVKEVIER